MPNHELVPAASSARHMLSSIGSILVLSKITVYPRSDARQFMKFSDCSAPSFVSRTQPNYAPTNLHTSPMGMAQALCALRSMND